MLHEALDRAQAGVPAIVQPLRHGLLHIEGEPLLGPVGEEVEVTAHRPQEGLATAEAAIFVEGEDAGFDELGLRLIGIEVLGEPVQGMQIAQAALAVLDIGLDQIA